MAVRHNYGWNPKITPFKQYVLKRDVGHFVGSSVHAGRRCIWPVFFGDMTAGPGEDPTGAAGSPLIIARQIADFRAAGHNMRFLCAEKNPSAMKCLRETMGAQHPTLEVEYFRTQSDLLAEIPKDAVGFTYWDTRGYWDLDTDLLTSFARSHPHMDMLITRDTIACARMLGAAHTRANTLTLPQYLALMGKERNYIQHYAHGWHLGFASNWTGRLPAKMRYWLDLSSAEGKAAFDEPNEPDAQQGGLPWGA